MKKKQSNMCSRENMDLSVDAYIELLQIVLARDSLYTYKLISLT